MGVRYICDGCTQSTTEDKSELEEHGPLARLYCTACVEVIKDYEIERDRLHGKVANTWNNGLAVLRRKFGKKIKVLPDA